MCRLRLIRTRFGGYHSFQFTLLGFVPAHFIFRFFGKANTHIIIYDEIVRLLNTGVKKVENARRTGVSQPTINKIEKELDKGL